MADYEPIAHAQSQAMAQLLVTALRAHGFTPRMITNDGLPGIWAGLSGPGPAVYVPVGEVRDARPLAQALLADMIDDGSSGSD